MNHGRRIVGTGDPGLFADTRRVDSYTGVNLPTGGLEVTFISLVDDDEACTQTELKTTAEASDQDESGYVMTSTQVPHPREGPRHQEMWFRVKEVSFRPRVDAARPFDAAFDEERPLPNLKLGVVTHLYACMRSLEM